VNRWSLEELKAHYLAETGMELPAPTEERFSAYKLGHDSIERGLHGRLWTLQGEELFTWVRTTQQPFLIVGEVGERTIKPGARPRFFILPSGNEPATGEAADEDEAAQDSLETQSDENLYREDLWENSVIHFLVGEPVADAKGKAARLTQWLGEMRNERRGLTAAQISLAGE
jgi:hypothetical protein